MIYYVIPAREGSKGFPYKNRKLFDITANEIRNEKNVIVTTDDIEIARKAEEYNFKVLNRCKILSDDYASLKHVLMDVVFRLNLKRDDLLVCLYLTYPQRKAKDIRNSLLWFFSKGDVNSAKSMLCKQPIKSNPYLCMYETVNDQGSQVISHNLYRRQDYLETFEISHFIIAMYVDELFKLNNNLYNNNTFFYSVDNVVDVDYEKDLELL